MKYGYRPSAATWRGLINAFALSNGSKEGPPGLGFALGRAVVARTPRSAFGGPARESANRKRV